MLRPGGSGVAKKRSGKQHKRKTLAKKLGVSSRRLSRKIALVERDDPSLTPRQVIGKAAGILRGAGKKRGQRGKHG